MVDAQNALIASIRKSEGALRTLGGVFVFHLEFEKPVLFTSSADWPLGSGHAQRLVRRTALHRGTLLSAAEGTYRQLTGYPSPSNF